MADPEQPADPQSAMEFECPLCGGAFEADLAMLGQAVECPHCGMAVELPDQASLEGAAASESPPAEGDEAAPADTSEVSPTTPAETPADRQLDGAADPGAAEREKPRPRTQEERAAARKRLNLTLAAVGAAVLVLAFVLLVKLA